MDDHHFGYVTKLQKKKLKKFRMTYINCKIHEPTLVVKHHTYMHPFVNGSVQYD